MSAYHAEVISDTPGSERVEIYEVAALGHNGKLVDILVGDKARDYIRQFLADCEERDDDGGHPATTSDYEEAQALLALMKREEAFAKLRKRIAELAQIAADNDALAEER